MGFLMRVVNQHRKMNVTCYFELLPFNGHLYGPQFSAGHGISSQAAEFTHCRGIFTFPRNLLKRLAFNAIVVTT